MMKLVLNALAFFFMMTSMAVAEWPLEKMNKHIDSTNWIIENKCSGTTISKIDRLILTNFHCISEAIGRVLGQNMERSDVVVFHNKYDNFSIISSLRYSARIVGMDAGRDLALIQIRDPSVILDDVAVLPPENYKIVRGQKVYSVGNPLGMDDSLVIGNISSIARTIYIDKRENKYIQFSGGTFGGSSGGALYDDNGLLIGVVTAGIPQAPFIGLAVPFTEIAPFLRKFGVI